MIGKDVSMKFKEKLKEKGFTEEQLKDISEAISGEFIPKARFDEVNEENKALKATVGERDKQLEELKKTSGDNEELKKSIEKLQSDNKALSKKHEAEMRALKLDNAVKTSLTAAGAKNIKAVTALLALDDKTELSEDGTVKGLAEQIQALVKSDPYLFNDTKLKGVAPGESKDGLPGGGKKVEEMNYTELAAYLKENPDAKI